MHADKPAVFRQGLLSIRNGVFSQCGTVRRMRGVVASPPESHTLFHLPYDFTFSCIAVLYFMRKLSLLYITTHFTRYFKLHRSGHILSRIYNCTKHGNRPIDNSTTAHFTLHISFLQLRKLCVRAR